MRNCSRCGSPGHNKATCDHSLRLFLGGAHRLGNILPGRKRGWKWQANVFKKALREAARMDGSLRLRKRTQTSRDIDALEEEGKNELLW